MHFCFVLGTGSLVSQLAPNSPVLVLPLPWPPHSYPFVMLNFILGTAYGTDLSKNGYVRGQGLSSHKALGSVPSIKTGPHVCNIVIMSVCSCASWKGKCPKLWSRHSGTCTWEIEAGELCVQCYQAYRVRPCHKEKKNCWESNHCFIFSVWTGGSDSVIFPGRRHTVHTNCLITRLHWLSTVLTIHCLCDVDIGE